MNKKYWIVIKGNDCYLHHGHVDAKSFEHAYSLTKDLMQALSKLTIEQLSIYMIKQHEN